jgi:ribosome-associated translation inhibitor RaiA
MPCQIRNGSESIESEDIDISEKINIKLDQLSSKSSAGNIQFTRTGDFPDAFTIKGRYILKNQKIEITYVLKKGNQIVSAQQTESGPINQLDEILDKIITNVKNVAEK